MTDKIQINDKLHAILKCFPGEYVCVAENIKDDFVLRIQIPVALGGDGIKCVYSMGSKNIDEAIISLYKEVKIYMDDLVKPRSNSTIEERVSTLEYIVNKLSSVE